MEEETKMMAFGDIHGCYKAAETAVKLAEELEVQAVFLGDYVDRGPSAVETLRILIDAKQKYPNWVFLKGNHDQMLIDLIQKNAKIDQLGNVLETINYDYKQAAASYEEWKQLKSDEQNAVLKFLSSLDLYYESEVFIFCHGILRNTGESINEKSPQELIWNYNYEPIWNGKKFIHGHLPIKEVKLYNKGLNINTECGYGGILTGVLIKDAQEINTIYEISEDGENIRQRKVDFFH